MRSSFSHKGHYAIVSLSMSGPMIVLFGPKHYSKYDSIKIKQRIADRQRLAMHAGLKKARSIAIQLGVDGERVGRTSIDVQPVGF